MNEDEIDLADLEFQLSEIKSAMGLEEQYPGQGALWLAYAAIVGGFSFGLQLLFLLELPTWAYNATWLVFVVVIVGALWVLARRTSQEGAPAAPDVRLIVGGLALLLFVLSTISQPLGVAADLPGVVTGAYFFAMAIALAGLGFVLVGNALKAYRIRKRDRWVFYAGGLWMLAYASAFPNVEFLRYTGFGIFGLLSVLHALLSYCLLIRT